MEIVLQRWWAFFGVRADGARGAGVGRTGSWLADLRWKDFLSVSFTSAACRRAFVDIQELESDSMSRSMVY